MATMAPPPAMAAPSEFGPGPAPSSAPQSILPAPAQPPSPGAMSALSDVNAIVTASRSLAQQFPATVPIVRQINDLVQQLQMTIIQAMPPTEVAAPPV